MNHGIPQVVPAFPASIGRHTGPGSGPAVPPIPVDANWINVAANRLPIFKAARTAMAAGTDDVRICLLGDAPTTKGSYASGYNYSFPYKMAAELTAQGVPAQSESRIGPYCHGTGGVHVPDTPYVYDETNDWKPEGPGNMAGGTGMKNENNSNPVTLAPPQAISAFDVYYWAGDNVTVAVTVDGVTVETFAVTSDVKSHKKSYTVTPGTHTLGFKRVSGGAAFFGGFVVREATKKIISLNLGCNSISANGWASNLDYPAVPTLDVVALMQPHLCIISLGEAEMVAAQVSGTFTTDMQRLITYLKGTL